MTPLYRPLWPPTIRANRKRLGRHVRNFDPKLRNNEKETQVLRGTYAKFSQNHPTRTALLSTDGRLLAEASPHDDVWGIGLRANDNAASNSATWRGQNLLGSIFERVRAMMREDLTSFPPLSLPRPSPMT